MKKFVPSLTRRSCLGLLAGAGAAAQKPAAAGSIRSRLPAGIPDGVAVIIERTLAQEPGSLNTDWFGTMLVKGMLEWAQRGVPEARDFAARWLDFHLSSDRLAPLSGPKARVVRAGGVYMSTYAGTFGLAFPCYEMVRQLRDERARRVCIGVAEIILHQTKRNHLGMVMHDDTSEFTIPDVCYFVVTPLMIASILDERRGTVFRDQALYQLRTYIDVFLMKDTGLAKTILTNTGLGKSYWTRATGWLLWAVTGMLRHLPPGDPHFAGFVSDLDILARGIVRVQDASGGLRVYLNDPSSPLETTGTAMCAMGLHEAIRKGWLSGTFRPAVDRAWNFVRERITADGQVQGAYTGWAVPAENGIVSMNTVRTGWIPGFILSTAYEMNA